MVKFGATSAELSEFCYFIPVGIAGVSLAWRASGFGGSLPIMSADAMHQLGVMLTFPHDEVVFHSLNSYLEEGAPSGLRVTAPMYRTREIGGHIAVRIDEFPLTMQPADFLPVDTLPCNEILTRQLDRHPELSWSPEPGSLRRKFGDRLGKEICVVEASSIPRRPSDAVLVRKDGHS